MGPTTEQQNEICFNVLRSLRDRCNVDFGNMVHEIEQGVGFAPFWPVFGTGSEGRIFFVNTEEVYSHLLILSDRPKTWEYTEAPRPTEVQIEDLDYDVEHLIASPRIFSAGVRELEDMLKRLPPITLEGLVKLMECNESEKVMVPVVALHNSFSIYRISADNFLAMVLDIYFDKTRAN